MNGLNLRTNVPALSALRNLESRFSALRSDVTHLSSGLRIIAAQDDPSGLAIAESLHARVAGYRAATENVQTARNATFVAEGALDTITSILQQIRATAVGAASDVTSDSDRENLQVEVDQMIDEIATTVRNTSFNGQAILPGVLAINTTGSEGGQVLLTLPDARAIDLGVSFVDVTTFSRAEASIGQLDAALDIITQQRAELGAEIVSLEEDAANGRIASTQLTASESAIRDAAMGVEATDLARNQLIVNAATAVLSHAAAEPGELLALLHDSALRTPKPIPLPLTPANPTQSLAAPRHAERQVSP